jgi:hypothetical protein
MDVRHADISNPIFFVCDDGLILPSTFRYSYLPLEKLHLVALHYLMAVKYGIPSTPYIQPEVNLYGWLPTSHGVGISIQGTLLAEELSCLCGNAMQEPEAGATRLYAVSRDGGSIRWTEDSSVLPRCIE